MPLLVQLELLRHYLVHSFIQMNNSLRVQSEIAAHRPMFPLLSNSKFVSPCTRTCIWIGVHEG